jgi:hypothetical protein
MAGKGLHREVRRKLCGFARRVARWVSDSRRQRFLQEMVAGLVIAGYVHLTKIARSLGTGANNVHADEKRLNRHLDSEHWSMQPVSCTDTVTLPEAPHREFLLVMSWRIPGATLLLLLVSRQARLSGRTAAWFVKAYRRRWGVEDATWGIKQRFHLEEFLVRSWRSVAFGG